MKNKIIVKLKNQNSVYIYYYYYFFQREGGIKKIKGPKQFFLLKKPISVAGTWTRVSRVRAEYPNQLDYNGWCFLSSTIYIINTIYFPVPAIKHWTRLGTYKSESKKP